MTGWMAISLGDVTGVGPEVTLKALAAEIPADSFRYLLIGDEASTRRLNEKLNLNLPLERWNSAAAAGRIFLHDPLSEPLAGPLSPGSPAAARAALASLTDGANRCLRHEMDALVTAPVSKESILRAGQPFIGQTEYLSQLAGTERTGMMLLGQDERGRWLRVVLATTHVPIKLLAGQLQRTSVEKAIELAAGACRDLGLPRSRIAVCGLNPHAGEGGKMGDEEITFIRPAVEAARQRGLDVVGPLSADALSPIFTYGALRQ